MTAKSPGGGRRPKLATIGYQAATIAAVVETLRSAGVEILADVRAVASSRRPGFSKTRLASHLADADIEYLHFRGLGTPTEGRVAARAGHHDVMRRVFAEHLETAEAQAELDALAGIVRSGKRVCLLCFEADPRECHRTLIAEALAEVFPLELLHLRPEVEED